MAGKVPRARHCFCNNGGPATKPSSFDGRRGVRRKRGVRMRYTTRLACVVVAAVALTGEPATAQISHQEQDINDHVVLRDGSLSGRYADDVCASASFKGKGLFRVSPDGTLASAPFTVPAGRLLVITDVEWTVSGTSLGLSLAPGATVRTRIAIGNGLTLTP